MPVVCVALKNLHGVEQTAHDVFLNYGELLDVQFGDTVHRLVQVFFANVVAIFDQTHEEDHRMLRFRARVVELQNFL